MAEGQAKRAPAERVVSASALVLGQMEVAQKALIQGGHEPEHKPEPEALTALTSDRVST